MTEVNRTAPAEGELITPEQIINIKKTITEAWRKIKKIIIKSADLLVDAFLRATNEHPKWWHLYKYSKKRRVRKKYRRKLMQQLLSKTREAIA